MIIKQTIDIEDTIRIILAEYMTAYCRPLPAKYKVPSVLVQQVGGSDSGTWSGSEELNQLDVVLDCRAKTEADAWDLMRKSIGILKAVAQKQDTPLRYVEVNTKGSWGEDPVRPDLAMCSARIRVTCRPESVEL